MHNKVKIEIIAGLYEELLNRLVDDEIYISSVKSTNFGVTLICLARDYASIAKIARKYQCRTRLLQRRGVCFFLKKYIPRNSIIIAVCMIFIYIFMFSKIIWRIDVISPDQQINQAVYNLLYSNQIYTGAVFSQEKNQNTIQQIFLQMEDVGYVTMNFYKGTLVCRIDPVQQKMPYLENAVTGNIIASQNGVIEDLRVYSGYTDIKIGQSVEKGDVLVSATYIDRNGNLQQVMPRAYIKAHCIKKYIVQVELEKEAYLRTGENTYSLILKIFGKDICLKKENLKNYVRYDTEKQFRYFDLLGFRLPLTVEKNVYHKKESVNINRDEETAYRVAQNIVDILIKNDSSLESIDNKNYSYTIADNTLNIECMVQGHYDITK